MSRWRNSLLSFLSWRKVTVGLSPTIFGLSLANVEEKAEAKKRTLVSPSLGLLIQSWTFQLSRPINYSFWELVFIWFLLLETERVMINMNTHPQNHFWKIIHMTFAALESDDSPGKRTLWKVQLSLDFQVPPAILTGIHFQVGVLWSPQPVPSALPQSWAHTSPVRNALCQPLYLTISQLLIFLTHLMSWLSPGESNGKQWFTGRSAFYIQ